MRDTFKINSFLFYVLGGLLGAIIALVFLQLIFGDIFISELRHSPWSELKKFFYAALLVLMAFIIAGISWAGWLLIKDQLKIKDDKIRTLAELSQVKNELIAFASHQLRLPLASFKWAVKMIIDGEYGLISQEQKSLLLKLYESNEHMEGLISDFLDASKLEAGQLEISLQSLVLGDLSKEIKDIIQHVEPMTRSKKIFLDYRDVSTPDLYLQADLKRLIHVVESFLENAINYTPANGRIQIESSNDEKNFMFQITDSGIGIPLVDQPKIFSKFFRGLNARKLQSNGSGLGLYLCKKTIEAHGGEISFTSEENKGTTFIFTLPLKGKKSAEEIFRKI